MPNLDLIPVNYYQPLTPYNHIADNQPLSQIVTRIELLNDATDVNFVTLSNSCGTAGSLDNRLNQSLNPDGSLISVAIDDALHNIADHMDGNGYVRMTIAERAKLSFVANGATDFGLRFSTISGIISFDDGLLNIGPSDTIQWVYSNGTMIPYENFPQAVRHVHYYGVIPVSANLISPNYVNYVVTSVATPYKAGSLRVYLNGVRLDDVATVSVPVWNGTAYVPTPFSYTEGSDVSGVVPDGSFALSAPINYAVTIFVDFDVVY